MTTYCTIYHNSLCTLPTAAYAKTFSIMLTLVRMSGMLLFPMLLEGQTTGRGYLGGCTALQTAVH
jgi:hypothetical protein